MQVEDKNASLSNKEKESLTRGEKDNTIEVQGVNFETKTAIKENYSAEANVIGKYYTLKVCLKDNRKTKNMVNIPIYLDGKLSKIDGSGCMRWSHEIKYDFSEEGSCRIFSKEIKISNNKKKEFKYAIDYVNDTVTDLEKSEGCLAQQKNVEKGFVKEDPINLGDINLYYNDDQTKRKSDFRFKRFHTKIASCLKVAKTGKSVRFAELRLKITNLETGEISYGKSPSLKTNEGGCFTTVFSSQYEQYLYSHWMSIDVEVSVLSGPLKGTKTNRIAYINPWEPSRGTFGIGEVGRVPQEREFQNKYAKFHLDGVMYIQIGNDTNNMQIDNYLGLTLAKTYQVVLNPYVDREHRYSPGEVPIRRLVSEGKFKLSMVVLAPKKGDMLIHKDNYENFEYITGAQKIVDVKNGVINEIMTIPFPINELPRLAVRTMSIFKIEPINDTGLRPTVVTGFFKARIPWIKTNVIQAHSLNLPNYVEQVWDEAFKDKENGQRIPKMDIDLSEIDSRCSKSFKKDTELCMKGMKEILTTDFDENTIGYNKYVDSLFSRLKLQNNDHVKNNLSKISPKQIYVNYLKNKMPKIEVIDNEKAFEKYNLNIKSEDYDAILPENKSINGMTENMISEFCKLGSYSMKVDGKLRPEQDSKYYYNDCLKYPSNYFDIQVLRHVDKIENLGDSYTNGFGFNLGERYNVSENDSNYTTDNRSDYIGIDTGNKIDIPFISDLPFIGKYIPNLGFKAGRTWQHNEGHTRGDGYQLSESIGTDKSLAVEKFVVNVHARFERCFLITSKSFEDQRERSRRLMGLPLIEPYKRPVFRKIEDYHKYYYPMSEFGIHKYICDKDTKLEKYTEAWYFMQARIDSSLGRDFDGPTERKILRSFRGGKSYFELRQALRDINERNLVMNNIAHGTPEDELIKSWGYLLEGSGLTKSEAAKYLVDHVEGSFPGTIEGGGADEYPDN